MTVGFTPPFRPKNPGLLLAYNETDSDRHRGNPIRPCRDVRPVRRGDSDGLPVRMGRRGRDRRDV